MKLRGKRCFKWTLITGGILALIVWALSSLGDHHRRFRQLGAEGQDRTGFRNGQWMSQPYNLHEHFHHGGMHILGLLLFVVFWGLVIVTLLKVLRKRFARQSMKRIIASPDLSNLNVNTSVSANGQFLDEWEKNVKNKKEDL